MIFKKVVIKRFKSFRRPTTFAFPEDPGLYLVSGKNLAEPDLGGNGTGKTTLWDAVCWCLYGKTVRGSRAGQVVSWGKKSCSVVLTLEMHDNLFEIKRTRNPNGLYLAYEDQEEYEWTRVDQSKIDELIGLNYECFLNAVILGQFNLMFFDLPRQTKLDLFSDILGLSFWSKRAYAAKQEAKRVDEAHRESTEKRAGLVSALRVHEDSLATTAKEDKAWAKENKAAIKEAGKYQRLLNSQYATASKCLKTCRRHLEKVGKEEALCVETIAVLREDLPKRHEVTADWDRQAGVCMTEISRLRGVRHTIASSYPRCYSCKQRVTRKHRDAEMGKCNVSIEEARSTYNVAMLKYQQAVVAEGEIEVTIRRVEDDRAHWQEEHRRLDDRVRGTQQEVTVILREQHGIGMRLCDLKEAKNPYGKRLAEQTQAIKVTKRKVKKAEKRERRLRRDLDAYNYWADGFKYLRLWIIDRMLRGLEVEVNNNLSQLGLADWKITFDVERETQAGGVSKGFTVFIHAPDLDKPMPWETWSGGETQRLRLAGAMGVMGLLLGQRGCLPNVEVWDEPTAHLSEEGIEDLLDLLVDRAERLGKQIWLVDHRSLDYGEFTGEICIVKGRKGSVINWV